jgi:hypothetical protein
MISTYNLAAHTLSGRTSDPHPKPAKECAQRSVSGESSQ